MNARNKQRPVITVYDTGRVARSTTPQAAVQAASRRLLRGDYWHATVLRQGRTVATLACVQDTIHITLNKGYSHGN